MVVAPDDELEEVVAEHLEDHADVRAVDAADLEVVQQLDAPLAETVRLVALANLEKLMFQFEFASEILRFLNFRRRFSIRSGNQHGKMKIETLLVDFTSPKLAEKPVFLLCFDLDKIWPGPREGNMSQLKVSEAARPGVVGMSPNNAFSRHTGFQTRRSRASLSATSGPSNVKAGIKGQDKGRKKGENV